MRCFGSPDATGWTTGSGLVAPSRSAACGARRFAQPNEEQRRTNTVIDSIVVACMGTSFEFVETHPDALRPGYFSGRASRLNVQVREVFFQLLALLLQLL